jgi:hypothetical protein
MVSDGSERGEEEARQKIRFTDQTIRNLEGRGGPEEDSNRLKKLAADLSLDKQILQEMLDRKWSSP